METGLFFLFFCKSFFCIEYLFISTGESSRLIMT